MEGIVPVRHAGTYGLAHPVVWLREAIDGRTRTQSCQPLLDDAPSSYGVIVIVGIGVAWTEDEDQFKIVLTGDFDDLKDGAVGCLIESRFVWFFDVGAPDIRRKSLERRLWVASDGVVQVSARLNLTGRPSA
jgi:hypothetical protein